MLVFGVIMRWNRRKSEQLVKALHTGLGVSASILGRMSIMRIVSLVAVFSFAFVHAATASTSALATSEPIGSGEGIFNYRFERGRLNYDDVLTMSNGKKCIGKVQEWANQVLLFNATGHVTAYSLADVMQFETRRVDRHTSRPDLPDLTVAYIERLPRDPSWHGHVVMRDGLSRLDVAPDQAPWQPSPGSEVTFRVHVLNAGVAESTAVPCRILIDGQEVSRVTVKPLSAGAEQVIEVSWSWQEGQHAIRVEIDSAGKTPEIVRWNNVFVEPIRALGVTVVVARDRYDAFSRTPSLVDSFCFEDYIQYHMRNMNALFKASVYPTAPDGILERVRCDRIIVVNDPLDEKELMALAPALRRGGKADGLAEYAAILTLGRLSEGEDLRYDALKVDWDLLRQLGLQIGLVDLTKTDTKLEQCCVLDKFGRYAQRRFIAPSIRTLMYTAGGFPFTESEACFLNRTLGRPRGFQGDYLYQVPEKIVLEVLSNAGTLLGGVQVDVFQLKSEGRDAGKIIGIGREDPLISAVTDARGRVALANLPAPTHKTPGGYELGPNPFGKIATDGSNGLLLLRLRIDVVEEFHFLPLSVCNLAVLRNHRQEFIHRLQTRFGAPGGPPRPPDSTTRMRVRTEEKPPLLVYWWSPEGVTPNLLAEYRVYKRTGFGGDDARPWVLSSIREPNQPRMSEETYFDEFSYDGPYSLDTFFAVSAVDKNGRESSLSEPTFLPYGNDCVQFAIDGQAAYMTLQGTGPAQMLYWDSVAGTQPYGVRTDQFAGYSPGFSGIAFTPDHQMVVTDPKNNVLAFYDVSRHELVDLIPNRGYWPGFSSVMPGEFSQPADVAVDDAGNLYVADQGNHRVQILDSRGRFKAMLDDEFRFKSPYAVGYANGHVCVTDFERTRCRVYDVSGDNPKFVRELPQLFDAGRGLVNKSGRVFITGRTSETGTWAVLIFAPEGKTARLADARAKGQGGNYHKPRGLYLYREHGGNLAYFANDFPFDVRFIDIEQD